jgi:hypothetical protein
VHYSHGASSDLLTGDAITQTLILKPWDLAIIQGR